MLSTSSLTEEQLSSLHAMKHPQALSCHLYAILDEIEKTRKYAVTLTKEEFIENDIIHEATLYRLTTIGNLLYQLSLDLTPDQKKKIRWVTSFDYRTLLTSYWTVDLERVYTLVAETNELSDLQQQIATFIQSDAAAGKRILQ